MLRIRSFTESDRPLLEAIYRIAGSRQPGCRRNQKRSDFSRDTEGEAILVAVGHNDEPVGFISVWEPDRFIHHLYVRACSRRKGIGEALLDALRARVAKPWRLKCLRANSEAIAFYLAQGWNEISSGTSEDGPFALLERA
jgi:ribosomal protein S18 acetylase RimI-like enzyme